MPVNQSRDFEIVENRALERFRKISPPKFFGGSDPEVTENWLKKMINILSFWISSFNLHLSLIGKSENLGIKYDFRRLK